MNITERIQAKVHKIYKDFGHTVKTVSLNPGDYNGLYFAPAECLSFDFSELHVQSIGIVRVLCDDKVPLGHIGTDTPEHLRPPWTITRSADYAPFTVTREMLEASRSSATAHIHIDQSRNQPTKENRTMKWEIRQNDNNVIKQSVYVEGGLQFKLDQTMDRAEWKELVAKVNELFDVAEAKRDER